MLEGKQVVTEKRDADLVGQLFHVQDLIKKQEKKKPTDSVLKKLDKLKEDEKYCY
jgi:hypothetical protein